MKLLLDTHLLLWAAGEPRRLSKEARTLIDNPDDELLFSAASLWEVAIKRGLGWRPCAPWVHKLARASGLHKAALAADSFYEYDGSQVRFLQVKVPLTDSRPS